MPPILYLVRHAHASDSLDDATRPLSKHGHREIVDLADFFRRTGAFQPEEVWHSPLLRATETAERLCHELKLKPHFRSVDELIPEVPPAAIARKLGAVGVPLALVGHEPNLSGLASLLVAGEDDPVVFTMKKAAVLALEPTGRRWCVRWHVSPELLG